MTRQKWPRKSHPSSAVQQYCRQNKKKNKKAVAPPKYLGKVNALLVASTTTHCTWHRRCGTVKHSHTNLFTQASTFWSQSLKTFVHQKPHPENANKNELLSYLSQAPPYTPLVSFLEPKPPHKKPQSKSCLDQWRKSRISHRLTERAFRS